MDRIIIKNVSLLPAYDVERRKRGQASASDNLRLAGGRIHIPANGTYIMAKDRYESVVRPELERRKLIGSVVIVEPFGTGTRKAGLVKVSAPSTIPAPASMPEEATPVADPAVEESVLSEEAEVEYTEEEVTEHAKDAVLTAPAPTQHFSRQERRNKQRGK